MGAVKDWIFRMQVQGTITLITGMYKDEDEGEPADAAARMIATTAC